MYEPGNTVKFTSMYLSGEGYVLSSGYVLHIHKM